VRNGEERSGSSKLHTNIANNLLLAPSPYSSPPCLLSTKPPSERTTRFIEDLLKEFKSIDPPLLPCKRTIFKAFGKDEKRAEIAEAAVAAAKDKLAAKKEALEKQKKKKKEKVVMDEVWKETLKKAEAELKERQQVRWDEVRKLKRRDSKAIPPSYITNNLPLVASLIAAHHHCPSPVEYRQHLAQEARGFSNPRHV
jgi:hypothetical protein